MSAPANSNQEGHLAPPDPAASTLSTNILHRPEALSTGPEEQDSAVDTVPQTRTIADVPPEFPSLTGYEILEELGRGGMGVVYKARQLYVNRLVALKVILLGEQAHPSDRLRFLAEAEIVARLRHPNIVQLHEFGEYKNCPYFTLEYIEGGTLTARLREAPLTPGEAAHIVEQLARAAQCAHEAGIIHRDLKPANVLLASGVPKIADFGLAKRVEGNSDLTQSGAIVGTPSYMAPEQASGHGKDVGPSADVWALGAILYECLTGRPPFRAVTVAETLQQVLHDEPVSPKRMQRSLPRDLETICLRCLQKDPGQRYPSAEALADDLRRFREGRPLVARPVGMLERSWRWCWRNRLVAALLAALILAVVTGFAGVTWMWLDAEHQRQRAQENESLATRRAEEARHAADDLESALASLSETFTDLGRAQVGGGAHAAAIRDFERANRIIEERVRETPSVPLQAALVQSYTFLGTLPLKIKQPDRAAEACARARRLVEELASTPPGAIKQQAAYGQTCHVLAGTLRLLNRPPNERLLVAQQAVVHLRAALDRTPANEPLRKETSDVYFELGHVQLQLGLLTDAAETALERRKLWPKNPDQVYDAACELARCMAAVGKGKKTLTLAEQAERQRFGNLAMAVLQEAVKMGLGNLGEVTRDADLAPLLERDDFRKLLDGAKK
jgi:tetratricopeptide (TPR) repeat protein